MTREEKGSAWTTTGMNHRTNRPLDDHHAGGRLLTSKVSQRACVSRSSDDVTIVACSRVPASDEAR